MAQFALAVTIAVGGLLLISGAAKLTSGRFAGDLAAYHLLPLDWVVPVAKLLPWVEVALGAGLLLSPWPTPLLVAAAGLLTTFTTGVVVNLVRGRRIRCGCRGSTTQISWRLAGTNATWILLALTTAALAPSAPMAVLASTSDRVGSGDGLAILLTLALAGLLVRLIAASGELHNVTSRVNTSRVSHPRKGVAA